MAENNHLRMRFQMLALDIMATNAAISKMSEILFVFILFQVKNLRISNRSVVAQMYTAKGHMKRTKNGLNDLPLTISNIYQ